jgi:hypothetical protein
MLKDVVKERGSGVAQRFRHHGLEQQSSWLISSRSDRIVSHGGLSSYSVRIARTVRPWHHIATASPTTTTSAYPPPFASRTRNLQEVDPASRTLAVASVAHNASRHLGALPKCRVGASVLLLCVSHHHDFPWPPCCALNRESSKTRPWVLTSS